MPVATSPGSATPYPCTASTVGTTATLILDSVANGAGRSGGGFVLPSTATAVEYQWANSGSGLTTTPGGIVYQVLPGGYIPFGGAPNTPTLGHQHCLAGRIVPVYQVRRWLTLLAFVPGVAWAQSGCAVSAVRRGHRSGTAGAEGRYRCGGSNGVRRG